MYGYQNWVVLLATMTCFPTSYGDVINRSVQRAVDPTYGEFFPENEEFFIPDRREINQGNHRHQNPQYNKGHHVDSVRHTHTSTRVDLPQNERVRNIPTTIRSHAKQDNFHGKNQFNASRVPDLESRSTNKRKLQEYDDPSRMIFEDDVSLNSSFVFRSRNCSHGLCDEVEGYPTERIQRILSKSKELKQFFSTKITDVIVTTPPTVGSRFGVGGGAVEALCATKTSTRFPKSAVNMNNIEKLLVNIDNFQQGIEYETCTSNDEPCKFSQDFPQGYVSSCSQKYTVRKLMVVGKESDNPTFDDFKIPSCCVCTVKQMTAGKT